MGTLTINHVPFPPGERFRVRQCVSQLLFQSKSKSLVRGAASAGGVGWQCVIEMVNKSFAIFRNLLDLHSGSAN